MFTTGRIVAIDDSQDYLDQLCAALHGMGIPVIPVRYGPDLPGIREGWFRHVRILFCDLHLVPGLGRPDQHYAVIGSLLERMYQQKEGPLLLVLWTDFVEQRDGLERYLRERHPGCLPIEILALSKGDFAGANQGRLPASIRDKLTGIPQLEALYEWEDAVAAASGACVNDLIQLALVNGGNFSTAMDGILTALARAATGKALAKSDPGMGIHEVLGSVLADKLAHLPDDSDRKALWKRAVPTAVGGANFDLPLNASAAINSALHIQSVESTSANGRTRGGVVKVADGTFALRFGLTETEVRNRFGLRNDLQFSWLAIQIEAPCDYANQKSLSLPFVLAAELPHELVEEKRHKWKDAFWISPAFLRSGEVKHLVANVRFVWTISHRKAENLAALYRLSESLVSELAQVRATHEVRPGIIELGRQ